MPRVSTETQGFYSVVSTDLADGSDLVFEVANSSEESVYTLPLDVVAGEAIIDIAQAQAVQWPIPARFTLVHTRPDQSTYRVRMKDADTGQIDYEQRAGPPPDPELTAPTPGSTLESRTATFQWQDNGNPDVQAWYLRVTSGSQSFFAGQIAAGTTSQEVFNLPSNGETLNVELSRLDSTGAWNRLNYTLIATTIVSPPPPSPGTVFFTDSIHRPPTLEANPIEIFLKPDMPSQGWTGNEFDLDGRAHWFNIPDGRDAIFKMAPDASGPMWLPVIASGGRHHVFEGIESLTVTEEGSKVGQTRNYLHSSRPELIETPNVNPRVAVGKMILSGCTHWTWIHGCKYDIAGHECDFVVPNALNGQINSESVQNRGVGIVNCNVIGWLSLDNVRNDDGNLMDGIHGDLIHNQKYPLGRIIIENVTAKHYGNGITQQNRGGKLRQFVVRRFNYGRDWRLHNVRFKSTGLPLHGSMEDSAEFSVEDWYIEDGNNSHTILMNMQHPDTGERRDWRFTPDSLAGLHRGDPPGGDYAPEEHVGFAYVNPY